MLGNPLIMIGSRGLAAAFLAPLLVSLNAEVLVPASSAWKYFKGIAEASSPDPAAWRQLGFNDSVWVTSNAPFFYGEGIGGGTFLNDMQGSYSSVFLRRSFTIADLSTIAAADLDVRADDGFVAWVNGQQVASKNAPANIAYNAVASGNAPEPVQFETFNIPLSALRTGQNVIALQLFNVSLAGSSDALIDAQLITRDKETISPTIQHVAPAPGSLTNLTQITVTFSEPVVGVNATDLRINDVAAASVAGTGSNYTFNFSQPPYGDVLVTWSIDANITDTAVPPNPFDRDHPNSTFTYELIDPTKPLIASTHPPRDTIVNALSQVDVLFTKSVTGVDPGDLRLNGTAATNVLGFGPGPYRFFFPAQSNGAVTASWTANHQIQDSTGNIFAGASWNYTVNTSQPLPRVRINEIMAANENGLKDQFFAAEDWIELYNDENFAVNLEGWTLTDDASKPDQWVFPRVTIGPKSFLVVFSSGRDIRDTSAPRLHTNFKMSLTGEYLGLYNADAPRRAVSVFDPYPEQRNDFSYGFSNSGPFRYFTPGTPGTSNGESTIVEVAEPVHFSVERGYYNLPFLLSLYSPTPGATVRYTYDGSEPTETNGTNYTGSLLINRTRMVRAAAFKPGALPSVTRTHTYLYNIPISRMHLPTMSLVTASNHLYGTTGIMETNPRNTTQHGMAWERPVSVELIRPADNGGFQIDCGIRIQGGGYVRERYDYRGSSLPFNKYSFRLYFRGDYGAGKLNYKLFPEIPLESFDEVVLRAGMNDHSNPFIRDETVRLLAGELGQVTSHGTFVHLFLNGIYKGLYNPTERISPKFLQAWHGGSENWDVIAQFGEIAEGDAIAWNQLRSLASTQNPANRAVMEQIAERLDVENFIDYLLVNIYAGTADWPHNNWRAARERTPRGKFRFYVWDAEWAFGYDNSPSHNPLTNQLGGTTEIPTLFNRLKLSPEFRLQFADRAHKHFFNNGALTDEKIRARYESIRVQVATSIPSFNNTISTWITQRRRYITNHIITAGLMFSSNAPAFNLSSGRVPANVPLTMSALSGEIWYTTNGVDPRVPFTGTVHPDAVRYTGPITLAKSTAVKARTLSNAQWSAVTEGSFQMEQLGIPIRITEIMYNPVGGDAYEFIEIQNIGASPVDMGGFTLEGITYRFPQNAPMIQPGARWILASALDPAAFSLRYPQVQVQGRFEGALSNGGETLILRDADGNVVTMVDYDDENAWPKAADGTGRSLELHDVNGDPGAAANWLASSAPGGSPAAQNSSAGSYAIRLNEIFASGNPTNSTAASDWIELHNSGLTSVDLSGWSITDDSNPRRFVFPSGTQLAAGGYLQLWCDTNTTAAGLHTGFGLNSREETVLLYDSNTNRVDAVTYGLQLPGFSIGRSELNATWTLTLPTAAARNEDSGLSANVVINEVFPNPRAGEDDWLELHNINTNLPAAIGGFYLSISNNISRLPELSFINPGGFVQIIANENYSADELALKLPASGATLVLSDSLGSEVHRLIYRSIREGVSFGCLPDGSTSLSEFPASASPALPNYLPNVTGVQISEVLAAGSPDWIEVYNPLTNSVDLGGMSISVNDRDPGSWMFLPGTSLAPGAFLQVDSDPSRPGSFGGTSGLNTGVDIHDNGSAAYLFDRFGQLVDFVEFGAQLPGSTIGRNEGIWSLLSAPSPGATNALPALLGNADLVKFNEWMASPAGGDDWFELFNPEPLPVHIGGFYVTDDPSVSGRTNTQVKQLTFISPLGFILLQADGEIDKGADHVAFSLDAFGESLRLYNNLVKVDEIFMLVQANGTSEGRFPDGATNIIQFPGLATPAAPNLLPGADTDADGMPDEWENVYELNRLSAADAALDSDGDGMSNLEEYRAGTDPRSTASLLSMEIRESDFGVPILSFRAAANKSYSIMATDSLQLPNWERVGNIFPGAERQVDLIDDEQGLTTRFYRLISPMQP